MTGLDAITELVRSIVREELSRALAPRTDGYLSVASAAEVADVSPATVRRWIRTGKLPSCGSGKLLRVRRADLDRVIGAPKVRTEALTPEEIADLEVGS